MLRWFSPKIHTIHETLYETRCPLSFIKHLQIRVLFQAPSDGRLRPPRPRKICVFIFSNFFFCRKFAAVSLALAVSAGNVYPAKTGHAKGGIDGGSKQPQRPLDDDRFHMQSPDGQYVFGHTSGDQVSSLGRVLK